MSVITNEDASGVHGTSDDLVLPDDVITNEDVSGVHGTRDDLVLPDDLMFRSPEEIQVGYDRVVHAICMHVTRTIDGGHLVSGAFQELDVGVLSPPIL